MSQLIHTIEVNGQVLTRKTDGYTRYSYAVPKSGRKIEAIRASLQSVINSANPELVSAKLEAFLDSKERTFAWTPEQRADFISDQTEQKVTLFASAAKRAQKELKALEHFAPGTFVWEKASWHSDFQLAMKAARGDRALVKTAVVAEA